MFQWYRDGLSIPNAVQSFYYIDHVTPDLRGYYTCEAINSQGAATSNSGLVTIPSEFHLNTVVSRKYAPPFATLALVQSEGGAYTRDATFSLAITPPLDREMFSSSGFVLALPIHHGDLES